MIPKETLEEFCNKELSNFHNDVRNNLNFDDGFRTGIILGIRFLQQERSYSEEEVRNAIEYGAELGLSDDIGNSFEWTRKKDLWFEQFKNK